MKRLRVVGFVVQPQFVVDDGDTLTPLPVGPVNVSAADWPNVLAVVAEATEALRQQVEEPPPQEIAPDASAKP